MSRESKYLKLLRDWESTFSDEARNHIVAMADIADELFDAQADQQEVLAERLREQVVLATTAVHPARGVRALASTLRAVSSAVRPVVASSV